jgi:hypothetical protein
MLQVKALAAKAAVTLVVVGSLAGGTAAAAAGPAVAESPSHHTHQVSEAGRARACRLLHRAETFGQRNGARFAARTAQYQALEARAQSQGHASLARYWKSIVTRRDTVAAKRAQGHAARLRREAKHLAKLRRAC